MAITLNLTYSKELIFMKFTRLGDRFINVDKITYVDFSGGLNNAKIFFSSADNLRSSQAADFLALNPAESQMLLSFLEETFGSQIILEEPVNPNQLSFEMSSTVPTQTNEIEEEVPLDTTEEIEPSLTAQTVSEVEQVDEDEDAELEDIDDEQATTIEEGNNSEEVVEVDDEVEVVEEVESVEDEAELDQEIVELEGNSELEQDVADDTQPDEEIEQSVEEAAVFDEPETDPFDETPAAPTPVAPIEDPNKHSFSRRNQVTYLR